jgi:transposase-like protein
MRSQPRYFSDSFKLGVISRVLSGEMSKEQARIHYGIGGKSAILNWMRSFGYSTDSLLPVPMKKTSLSSTTNETEALKQQVKDLQKRLELEQQRSEFYQTMIDIAEREQGVQIRKKSDTKPSY